MTINIPPISFKGYDAAPLKNIYLDESYCDCIEPEMKNICLQEDINIRKIHDGKKWTQDDKSIIEINRKPYLLANNTVLSYLIYAMKNRYNIFGGKTANFLTGGNTYIGKCPNGDKWLITGEKLDDERKKDVASFYQIKEENIHQISKPDFHIDLGIRPIGYPYILVNDPELAQKKLDEIDDGSEEFKQVKQTFMAYKQGASITYASADKICSELEKLGFSPIRIAGVFYNGINFMNGIVNKHPDGTMSYITNSSECMNNIHTKLQQEFEKELREKVPDIENVYFVQGIKRINTDSRTNYMMNTLKYDHGGIHCMVMEEPEFKIWA